MLQRPQPEVIPKSTITYRPTINKSGKTTPSKIIKKTASLVSTDDDDETDAVNTKGTIISKWTYTKKIKNGFYA
ncbi:MAG: hypothetical protein WCH65_06475 [bacterium]